MKKKLFLLIIFFCCIVFYSCTDNVENETIVQNSSINVMKRKVAKSNLQTQANITNAEILYSFSKTRNASDDIYPNYYGGSYVTPEGKLVILVKGDMVAVRKSIMAITDDSDIIYKSCNYSFQELRDIVDSIEAYLNMSIINKNVIGANILDKENKVIVYLKNCSEKNISNFKNDVINHSAIIFKQSGNCKEERINILAGSKAALGSASNSAYGSFAFRAVETSGSRRKGMVTSGHVATTGTDIYSNGNYMGTCSSSQKGGQVDAAFVPSTTGFFEPSNNFYLYDDGNDGTLSTNVYAPAAGTSISLIGARSGIQIGKVISTYAIQTFGEKDTYTCTNLTVADYKSEEGDSGGLIFTELNWTYYTLGVHIGSNIYNERFFCKAQMVLDALKIERY